MTNIPHRALIVIDVQNEYDSGGLRIEYPPVEDSLRNIAAAMDAASASGIPVVVVQQMAPVGSPLFATGSHGWELHEMIAGRPRDHFVPKNLPSAFAGTDLGEWLKRHDIDTLTVAGFMTHNCDDTTIKHAFDAGLAVEFLSDASGSVSYANAAGFAHAEEIHRVFNVVQQSRFAAVLSTAAWLECVAKRSIAQRDSIHSSHQRALNLIAPRTAALCNHG
jgi:nicotinamidase-related amidase